MVVLAPFIPYAVAGAQAGLGFLNMDAQNTEKRRQRNARQTQLSYFSVIKRTNGERL